MTHPDATHLHSAVPTLLAPDVAGTVQWYAEHLGFRLAGSVPEEPPFVYASLMRDGVEIMLRVRRGLATDHAGGGRGNWTGDPWRCTYCLAGGRSPGAQPPSVAGTSRWKRGLQEAMAR